MRNHFHYRLFIFKELCQYSKGSRRELAFVSVSGVFMMMFALLPPFFYKIFIDRVLVQKEIGMVSYVFLGLILTFLLKTLAGFIETKNKNSLKRDVAWRIMHVILERNISDRQYLKKHTGELKRVIENDVTFLAEFFEAQVAGYYISILSIVILVLVLFSISWKIAIASILFIPVTFWIDYRLSMKENINAEKVRYLESERYQFVLDSLNNWKEIKTLGLGKRLVRKYVNWLHRWASFNMTDVNYAVLKGTVFPKIKELLLGRIFIYIIGSLLILKGQLTIGGLLVFAQYYYDFLCKLENFSKLEFSIEENKVHYDKVLELLRTPSRAEQSVVVRDIGEVRFEDVDFVYSAETDFKLEQICFALEKGDKVAFVGLSGSGKTTIAKLLTNQCQPTSGKVLINGKEIETLDKHSLYRKMGIVMQDSKLINMSLRDNILLGDPDADDTQIREACMQAGILSYIDSLENGLDTVVGESGIMLSGGQRQRIILARVFLQKPDLYLFDEATASLDNHSENYINRAIAQLSDKTVIIIAHRLSSIQMCKKIYVVSDGRITAAGSQEELLRTCEYFRSIYLNLLREC